MKKRFFEQDGNLVYHKQSDPTAVVESAKALNRSGATGFDDNWHLARVPMHLLEQWIKQSGIRFDDRQAIQDMLKKKLLDGDFKDLRVHEGTW